jgi:hypothetical protein
MLSQLPSPSRVRFRRARERPALDRCGPLRLAPLGRKSNNKKDLTVFFFVERGLLLVLRLCPDFHQKMLRQDRLQTTISTSVDT